MDDKICMFATGKVTGFCKILVGEKCDGKNNRCSFWTERDKAITLNRERGNCLKCKYMGNFCKLSTEEEAVDNLS